jgi:hypothetical protein
MLRVSRTASEERLSRKKKQQQQQQKKQQAATEWSRWKAPKTYLGSRRISNS